MINDSEKLIMIKDVDLKQTLNLLNSKIYNCKTFPEYEKYSEIIKKCNNSMLNFKKILEYYLENLHFPKCKVCRKDSLYFKKNLKKTLENPANTILAECCSKKCQVSYGLSQSQKTKKEKYGSSTFVNSEKAKLTRSQYSKEKKKSILEKRKASNFLKYGKNSAVQSSTVSSKIKETYSKMSSRDKEKISKKRESTNQILYGCSNPFQVDSIKEKIKKTCLEKYGSEIASKSSIVKNSSKKTCLRKFGNSSYSGSSLSITRAYNKFLENFKSLCLLEKLEIIEEPTNKKERSFIIKCAQCGEIFNFNYNGQKTLLCRKCNPLSRSKLERDLSDHLQALSIDHLCNVRDIIKKYSSKTGLELDLFVPSKDLAIEINGIYWHSLKSLESIALNKNKHLNKSNLCKDKNIKLLQFTDLELINKKEICYSIVNSNLGIYKNVYYARKCKIGDVNNLDLKTFLGLNHIQGYSPSSINLGLYHENELVQIMTFGKSRFSKSHTYELIRLCSKLNTKIIGGSSKLFKHFLKKYLKENESVISYCDLSKFSGEIYTKLGFSLSHQSSPNYFYWDGFTLHSRQKFQKHKLKELLLEFDSSLTEKENMLKNNFSIYYDCGNKIYELCQQSTA